MTPTRRHRSPRWAELAAQRARVVELVASGLTDRAIARELGRPQSWVASVITHERGRVGAESRTALAVEWVLSADCTYEQRARVRARIVGAR